MGHRFLIFFLLIGSCFLGKAQGNSSFILTARQNVVKQYSQYFKNQSPLYNGTEYNEPLQTNDTHPFYNSMDWQRAAIEYADLVFPDVDVLCDLYGDKLVIEHFNGSKVQLIPAKLRGFTIDGKRFLNITPRDLPAGLSESGFYQLLYDGDVQCLVRRKKNMRRTVESHEVQVSYKEKVSYFVRKEHLYYPVKSKRSLVNLLKDKRNELNQYMRKERISFKNDRDTAILKILELYDEGKK